MTKKDLCEMYAMQYNISATEAKKVINNVCGVIANSLANEKQTIFLRGFGTFKIVERKAKKAQIIRNNETITIPAHNAVKFIPCDELKNKIAEKVEDF